MNTETLSEIRAKVSKIESLAAEGWSLDAACAEVDITARAYRRWKEVLEFSRAESGGETRSESLGSIMPELEASFGRVKVGAGEVLFRIGDFADHMYVVAAGSVYLLELEATAGPGEMVGEIGVFSEMRRRTATAIAAEDCELVRIPRDKALELTHRRPGVGLAITQVMADRLTRNAYATRAVMTFGVLSGAY